MYSTHLYASCLCIYLSLLLGDRKNKARLEKQLKVAYSYKDCDDDDSVFSTSRFFVTVVQIFVPVHELQLHSYINSTSLSAANMCSADVYYYYYYIIITTRCSYR